MATRSKQPVVDIANGVVWCDQERGFSWELSQVNWNVELFPDHSFRIGEEGKREVTKVGFESSELLGRSGSDSDDRAPYRGEEVVLFLER